MTSEVEHLEAKSDGGREMSAVAWIILPTDGGPETGQVSDYLEPLSTIALDQVGQAVRSDDRVCPVSTTSLVIAFGSAAYLVPLDVLGDRLARAIGPGGADTLFTTSLAIAMGITARAPGESSHQVAQRAQAAAGSSLNALDHDSQFRRRAEAVVTVDRPIAHDEAETPASPDVTIGAQLDGVSVRLHRRVTHRYRRAWVNGLPVLLASDEADMEVDVVASGSGHARNCNLCVLVVDPMAARDATPGFSSLAALSMAERIGCRTGTATIGADEPLVTSIDSVDVDVVVLVLDGAWVGRSPNWASGAWGRPAQLTSAYVDKGILVLAVSAGAGAGALASCVSQDALALFDLDRLPGALRSIDHSSVAEAPQTVQTGFPGRFRALLELTAGERRVLFYLTEGWTAQDIANDLVVSLTTVRSHIRSVLHKLEVRSQLAAVAIANSRDLEHHTVTANS